MRFERVVDVSVNKTHESCLCHYLSVSNIIILMINLCFYCEGICIACFPIEQVLV